MHKQTYLSKYFIVLISTLWIGSSLWAQSVVSDTALQATVLQQGNTMANLLLKKDYKGFTQFTYAPVVKMAGGEDKMIAYLIQSFESMESEGFIFTDIKVEACSPIIHLKDQLQCTLTEIITIQYNKGKLIQKSTLIAISNNNGKNWTFIDTHGATLTQLQETLKELSNDLVIPQKQ